MPRVHLRECTAADVALFFEHQLDSEARRLTASSPRDRAAFDALWAKIFADPGVVQRTILADDRVAGYVGSFDRLGLKEVCYELGREFWGRGIATAALGAFLVVVDLRPLFARVAKHNVASQRVVEKCGFAVLAAETYRNSLGDEIPEYLYRLV